RFGKQPPVPHHRHQPRFDVLPPFVHMTQPFHPSSLPSLSHVRTAGQRQLPFIIKKRAPERARTVSPVPYCPNPASRTGFTTCGHAPRPETKRPTHVHPAPFVPKTHR